MKSVMNVTTRDTCFMSVHDMSRHVTTCVVTRFMGFQDIPWTVMTHLPWHILWTFMAFHELSRERSWTFFMKRLMTCHEKCSMTDFMELMSWTLMTNFMKFSWHSTTCHDTSWHFMECHKIFHEFMTCHDISWHISWHSMKCQKVSRHVIECHDMSWNVMKHFMTHFMTVRKCTWPIYVSN